LCGSNIYTKQGAGEWNEGKARKHEKKEGRRGGNSHVEGKEGNEESGLWNLHRKRRFGS
jgi:hypothetical protein